MAYNSNNDPEILTLEPPKAMAEDGASGKPDAPQPDATPAPAPARQESEAFVRFRSCRWHQPAENGNSEFCTHREVKPYAGTTGFDADAWCPDCQYFKLRRSPKKRPASDEYSY